MWPFDGDLAALLGSREVVIAETYPTEFYDHLAARPGPGGKRERRGREPACVSLAVTANALGVTLTEDARVALGCCFGDKDDGEDRFDAFVGLLGMLNVVLGRREPGPPSTMDPDVVAVEGWMLGQGGHAAQPPAVSPLQRLASLIGQRNAIDEEIGALIGRPALPGHIGEFIAAEVFDIELERSATVAGYDGVFRSGPLAGATVNIKFYPKRDGTLDIPETVPDYFLVLAGPRSASAASSAGGTRPLAIDEVFLFEGPGLVRRLQDRGIKVCTAASVRKEEWTLARVWPTRAPGQPSLIAPHRQALLHPFASTHAE